MPRCVQGHEWQAVDEESAACPVCGMPVDDAPVDNLPDGISDSGMPAAVPPRQHTTVQIHPGAYQFVGAVTGEPTDTAEQSADEQSADELPSSATEALPSVPGYDVIFELGRGGMGVVYEAWQVGLQRRVALKMILADGQPSAEDYQRFRREAAVVARLQHPNIVQIYDIGEHRGLPYFALELVEGGSLGQRLAGQPQPASEAARLAQVLARAVQAAHDRGVIHRDLKPGNILLQLAEGTSPSEKFSLQTAIPKIADFGLAKLMVGDSGQTRTGVVMGTPSYMAPEQTSGKVEAVGPLTDLYALGAILYEMLTGRPPFSAPTAVETAVQVSTLEPVPPRRLQPSLPRDLETICLKCLRKQPRQRYASAREMADDLGRFLDGQPIEARPVSRLERGARWCRRNPVAAALAPLVAIVALVVLVGGWLWSVDQAERRATTTQRVDELLRAATTKQHDARAGTNPAAWVEALGFVNQADALLEAGPDAPELHGRVTALRDVLAREQVDADRAAKEAQRDQALLQRLEALRLDAGTLEGRSITFREGFPRLRAAFRDYGIDLFELPRAEAARRIRGKAIRGPLCEHLLYLSVYAPTAEQRDRLLAVLRLADSQPEREHLVADLVALDMKALKRWARWDGTAKLSSAVLLTLAMTLARHGEAGQGMELLRTLQDRFPSDFWVHYTLGVLAIQGEAPRWNEAESCFRAALALRPENPGVLNNLGLMLAHQGRIDESIRLLQRAVQYRPDLPQMRYNLGYALKAKGKVESACQQYQKAVALKKDFAHAYADWAQALVSLGRLNEAIGKLQKALELTDDPKLRADASTLLDHCRRLLPLAPKLEQVLRGELKPANGAEWLAYAELCYYEKRYAAAVRLAADALAAHPELLKVRGAAWHRYHAARYAALAAAGEGKDASSLTDADKSSWRVRAIDWLRADLDAWQTQWRTGNAEDRRAVGKALTEWLTDHALASLRDPLARERLPRPEQEALARLWNAVDALLRETRFH